MGRSKVGGLKKDPLYKRVRAGYIDKPLKFSKQAIKKCPVDNDGWKERVYQWIEDFYVHGVQHLYYYSYSDGDDREGYKTGDVVRTLIVFDRIGDLKVPSLTTCDNIHYRNPVRSSDWELYCEWLKTIDKKKVESHVHSTMNKIASIFHEKHPLWTFITYNADNKKDTNVVGEDPDTFLEVCDNGTSWTFCVPDNSRE